MLCDASAAPWETSPVEGLTGSDVKPGGRQVFRRTLKTCLCEASESCEICILIFLSLNTFITPPAVGEAEF